MPQTYQKKSGYRRYVEGDGSNSRKDATMPILQTNNEGKAIIVPGEIFCRWRGADGNLCDEPLPYSSTTALRRHYRDVHQMETESRRKGGHTTGYNHLLDRWYTQVSNGENPRWIPRDPPNPPAAAATNNTGNTTTTTPK